LALTNLTAASSTDERFLDGLRQRQLFTLAEKYCEAKLNESALPPRERVSLVVELVRTFTAHALNSAPAEREAYWKQASATVDAFRQHDPQNSAIVLVDVQAALTHLARGELARQEADLAADAASRTDEARLELRAAIRDLTNAHVSIAEQLRLLGMRRPMPAGSLDANELTALARNIDYQLSRAYRNLGLTYPAGSADRINAANQAAEHLAKLAAGDASDPLHWRTRLEQVACLRQIGDYNAAARGLDAIAADQPPVSVERQAQAERIRLMLDVGQVEIALKMADDAMRDRAEASPELDYVSLEAYLAAWQKTNESKQEADARQWQQRAAGVVRAMDEAHSPYWSRRAEALLAARVASSPGTSDLGLLTRSAESFYKVGSLDEAVMTYDQAAATARAVGRPNDAFAPALAAAAIQQQRKRYADAAKRFHDLALALPQNERASAAHLQAIYCTAQVLAESGSTALADYVALLEEHLKLWPQSVSADQARMWLGKVRERERAWQPAVQAYGGVTSESEHAAAAIEAASRVYQAWLADLKSRNQPTDAIAAEAAGFLENVITGGSGALPMTWTSTQRQAALDAARIWLEYTTNIARAQNLLQAALAAEGETSAAWREAALGWSAYALAAQGKHAEAAKYLEQLGGGQLAPTLKLLNGLDAIATMATPEARRQLADLSLSVLDQWQNGGAELSDKDRRELQLLGAKALLAAGRTAEATAAFKSLTAEAPNDPEILEAYAQAMLDAPDAAGRNVALEKYRELEKRSRPGSPRWFRAKYGLALAHLRLGNRARAAQIVKLTELLHPELGGTEMKAKFDALRSQ
jgi:outer membrane protein assembly factor BamD (BamD/ComL family)